ncbi:MAG: hypothetical protein U1C46_08705 [Bacteroidales bacterium]|nr:hypothetical protein [Bacteroidales bacterium]
MVRRMLIAFLFLLVSQAYARASDTLLFRGQSSAWVNLNPNNKLPLWLGGRYIPQANYQIELTGRKLIDFEASANIRGSIGAHLFDTISTDAGLKPYRVWARFSGRQFEVRLGLQKINFGSASMLRPLMWFDQLDPRDPLQLTDGVWALLGRYYFLNNANIWLWALYGNKGTKTWEIGKTIHHFPELGGRFQSPVPKGEAAFSYHFRKADVTGFGLTPPSYSITPEHRFALDGKWDIGIGLWFESVWIHKSKPAGLISNQEILNLGLDYTFALGNGLNVVFEHLWITLDEKAFALNDVSSFSGLSLSYPLGLNNFISAIFYHDWTQNTQYNFMNWRRQFSRFSMYFMAYWNPLIYRMPQQDDTGQFFSGKGLQIMIVFNH